MSTQTSEFNFEMNSVQN